ncbi:putative glycerophosphodiester phosphodiesterase, protein kinase RLK-Pelle-LRK10L-2 family [Rosa chinensis]|uniref:Putative glycerophosphodiester phosphodiesterase, protein kinase RLK-Pelle-LRK10L-2 family n=1 Tax=Rosa chinensis TaxID=74649 RepID=A0A2P6QFG2_ROSCH|nr:putative glycerophosphodiester phosphodiesterase, protein kinase RLK-Pelle-LRK10L-2 family [Rosa chinensis]
MRRENDNEDAEAFIQNIGPLAVKRYKFSDVRKMTNSFKDKLGQGGYGDVYEGKLLNGCRVAVKVLKESRGNGEDFVNVAASIRRTSHVNAVTLVGYCFEVRKKRSCMSSYPMDHLRSSYTETVILWKLLHTWNWKDSFKLPPDNSRA